MPAPPEGVSVVAGIVPVDAVGVEVVVARGLVVVASAGMVSTDVAVVDVAVSGGIIVVVVAGSPVPVFVADSSPLFPQADPTTAKRRTITDPGRTARMAHLP
jgi:hypothetical protein